MLAKRPLAVAPGAKAQYGLSDIYVLTRVFEKVTGKRYGALLQARLGLQCTGFESPQEDGMTRRAGVIPGRIGVYRWENGHQRTAEGFYGTPANSSGGAFACIGDLARWAVAMAQGKLLSPASEQRAATPFRLADGGTAPWGVVFTLAREQSRSQATQGGELGRLNSHARRHTHRACGNRTSRRYRA